MLEIFYLPSQNNHLQIVYKRFQGNDLEQNYKFILKKWEIHVASDYTPWKVIDRSTACEALLNIRVDAVDTYIPREICFSNTSTESLKAG